MARHRPALRAIPRHIWLRLLALGLLLYAITQGASFVALSILPAVTVNLFWSFSSATVALMSVVWLRERPTRFQWFGVALTVLGALIFLYPVRMPGSHLQGVAVALLGVLANGAASIVGREIGRSGQLHPLVVTVISMGIGSAALLGTGAALQGLPRIEPRSWAIVGWLAVVNTAFAFTLWNHTLRTLSATESSVINGTMLIWIPVLAVLFLGERVTAKEAAGLVVVGIGTLLVQLRHPRSVARLFARRSSN